MEVYYINLREDKNGNHSVHRYGCQRLADPVNRFCLGIFPDSELAVKNASEKFRKVVCCKLCCDCNS
ncbi:MAG TPA: hypothetical protein VHO46_12285 [Bacteroidales bacterium]|nr:hypothetical protein [Bacteroidales bacterium]